MLSVSPNIDIPLEEFEFTYARSGGPGGQNVNKVNSKALLRWQFAATTSLPEDVKQRFAAKYASRLTTEGELVLTSQKYRDQASNVQDCLDKLKEMLSSVATAPIKRRATKPTRASQERRKDQKKQQGNKKQNRRSVSDY